MPSALPRRLAVNPLPWVLGPQGFVLSEQTLAAAMTELRPLGFEFLQADVPAGWALERYRALLDAHGFSPAPGYFGADFADRDTRASVLEQARRHAATQAGLGLDVCFLAHDLVPERIQTPAQGLNASRDCTLHIAEGMAAAAEAAAAEGVRFALHPHVGSLVETDTETRTVLDATQGSALGFGPDTGHLSWAGCDPARIVAHYADRVLALHLKDVDQAAVATARADRADYATATGVHHVWTEPGRGNIDLPAVLDALPADFTGWTVLEVDVPNLPTPRESSEAARHYLLSLDFFTAEAAA